jgi:hypothetical protein
MNYKEQVDAMIDHLSKNSDSYEDVFSLVQALGVGIAVVSLIVIKEHRDDFLNEMINAIRADFAEKCASFDAMVEEMNAVDPSVRRDH